VLFGGWEPCSKTAFRGQVGAAEEEHPAWLSGFANFGIKEGNRQLRSVIPWGPQKGKQKIIIHAHMFVWYINCIIHKG
jgi:hypothetical protein